MKTDYDVIVVGGGFAGCCAAIAASRNGLDVLLTEKEGLLGGTAVNSLIIPFMRNMSVRNGDMALADMRNLTSEDSQIVNLSAGLYSEIVEELKKKNGLFNDRFFHGNELSFVFDEMTAKAGVKVLFHMTLVRTKVQNRKITELEFATPSGPVTMKAKTVIDATGDAQVSFLSGCSFRLGRPKDSLCQPMTTCFRICNAHFVESETPFADTRKVLKESYLKLRAEGKITIPREDLLIFRTYEPGVIHFNTTRVIKLNPTDVEDLSKAEAEGRRQVYELYTVLKEANPDILGDAYLGEMALNIGIRESRMIDGYHILNEDEMKACTVFPDAIASCNYDIDIHDPDGIGTSHYYFGPGRWYTIPYRTLVPKDIDNMLVAGRCISTTHEAQASVRIMPVCANLGQAAGIACAVAQKNNVKPIDAPIGEIQRILKESGAFFEGCN